MDEPSTENLPPEFLLRMQQILPREAYHRALDTFATPWATTFRVNGLRSSVDFLKAELTGGGFELSPVSWHPEAFLIPHEQRRLLTETKSCREGRLYIQTLSSMIPPMLLDPQPEDEILDLCVVPGSKTIQLAGMMGNRGRIAAVESVRSRFFRLRTNLDNCGVENVKTYLTDGAKVWRKCPEMFDRILVDTACSSEGRFNLQEPAFYSYWSPKKITEMVRKQKRLLFSAVQCLKPGGVLVYSTCTFAPEENERVLDGLLRKFGAALQVDEVEAPCPDVQAGLTEWKSRSFDPALRSAVRILPTIEMEGFFVCRLSKLTSTVDP